MNNVTYGNIASGNAANPRQENNCNSFPVRLYTSEITISENRKRPIQLKKNSAIIVSNS